MAKVKFTKVVDERFRGTYRQPKFLARKGDVFLLDDKVVAQIERDHEGLLKVLDPKAQPPEGVVAELVERAKPKEEPAPLG